MIGSNLGFQYLEIQCDAVNLRICVNRQKAMTSEVNKGLFLISIGWSKAKEKQT